MSPGRTGSWAGGIGRSRATTRRRRCSSVGPSTHWFGCTFEPGPATGSVHGLFGSVSEWNFGGKGLVRSAGAAVSRMFLPPSSCICSSLTAITQRSSAGSAVPLSSNAMHASISLKPGEKNTFASVKVLEVRRPRDEGAVVAQVRLDLAVRVLLQPTGVVAPIAFNAGGRGGPEDRIILLHRVPVDLRGPGVVRLVVSGPTAERPYAHRLRPPLQIGRGRRPEACPDPTGGPDHVEQAVVKDDRRVPREVLPLPRRRREDGSAVVEVPECQAILAAGQEHARFPVALEVAQQKDILCRLDTTGTDQNDNATPDIALHAVPLFERADAKARTLPNDTPGLYVRNGGFASSRHRSEPGRHVPVAAFLRGRKRLSSWCLLARPLDGRLHGKAAAGTLTTFVAQMLHFVQHDKGALFPTKWRHTHSGVPDTFSLPWRARSAIMSYSEAAVEWLEP